MSGGVRALGKGNAGVVALDAPLPFLDCFAVPASEVLACLAVCDAALKEIAKDVGIGIAHGIHEFAEHLPHHIDTAFSLLAGFVALDHR